MRQLVITGVGVVGPGDAGAVPVGGGVDDRPLPVARAFVADGFDPVELLGRRTTRFNHRTTLLALGACGAALADAGVEVTDEVRDGIGVTLGTTCGSVTGAIDFGWDSFAQERPYHVNAATFPNLVINTAAGAAAIKYGLRGANSTVAGGPLAGISALRHAAVTLRTCHADTILVGAAEEFSGPSAWFSAALRPDAALGEAAAVVVLERDDVAVAADRRPLARLASVVTRATDVTDPANVRAAVLAALDIAVVEPSMVRRVALRITGDAAVDAAQRAAVADVLDVAPVFSEDRIGDCSSAHAAMQLVETLAAARAEAWTDTEAGLVVAVDPDGAVGVAVVAGWQDPLAEPAPFSLDLARDVAHPLADNRSGEIR